MADPSNIAALKRAFGMFATGVTVVGALDEAGRPRGFTASAFTSVSLTPPILLVCVDYGSRSSAVFAKAPAFAVSVLRADQQEISDRFAHGVERFEVTPWETRETGAPILSACAAWFDCVVRARHDAGDHFILLGDIEAIGGPEEPGPALGYWRGRYADVTLREQG